MQALKLSGLGLSRLPEPSDPEYVSLKTAIDLLADFLQALLEQAAVVDSAWNSLAAAQESVARVLATTDPSNHFSREYMQDARGYSKIVATMAPPAGKDVTAVPALLRPGPDGRIAPYAVGFWQVRRFLAHLRAIQARYRDVCKAKAEFISCNNKLRSTEQRHGSNTSAGNMQRYKTKCEMAEKTYHMMQARVKEFMAAAAGKRERAIKIATNSFWLQQASLYGEMGRCLQSPYDAGCATEPLLISVDLMDGLIPPTNMFASVSLRPIAAREGPENISRNFDMGAVASSESINGSSTDSFR